MINRKILIGLSISLAITLPIIGFAKFHGGKVSNPKAGRLFQQEIEQIKELYDLRGVYNEMKAAANDITDVKGFWKDFSGNITSTINNKYKQGIFAESNQKKKILELTTNIEWMSKNELVEKWVTNNALVKKTNEAVFDRATHYMEESNKRLEKALDLNKVTTNGANTGLIKENLNDKASYDMQIIKNNTSMSGTTGELLHEISKIEQTKDTQGSVMIFNNPETAENQANREKAMIESGIKTPHKLPSFLDDN